MNIIITIPGFTPHGGIRVIIEWANRLSEKHHVTLYSNRPQQAQEQKWIRINQKVVITHSADCLSGSNVLIVTSPHYVHLLTDKRSPEKKFIFLQMLEHLFRPNDMGWQAACWQLYLSIYPMICISQWNIDFLKKLGRTATTHLVGNGVNINDFPIITDSKKKDLKTVLIEGLVTTNPTKDAYNIAAKVGRRLKDEGYTIFSYGILPLGKFAGISNVHLQNPTLEHLNELYEKATVLIKASLLDARSCSPMEAMTKGTVTARASEYADDDLIHGKNCLRCEYNEESLYQITKQLLDDSALRNRLKKECLNHVKKYSWDYWMAKIEDIIENKFELDRLCIISVVYDEPEWRTTQAKLNLTGYPINYVSRNGVGSLAKALNDGFKKYSKPWHDYVWFVTNVDFDPGLPTDLVKKMDETKFAALHPSFDSDHPFCRNNGTREVVESLFVEFTCPIVRTDVFCQEYLDEKMPYWGHDLDWGYRLREKGHQLGIYHGRKVDHIYIRNNQQQHLITEDRKRLRASTDENTRLALIHKYGENWKEKVWPQ